VKNEMLMNVKSVLPPRRILVSLLLLVILFAFQSCKEKTRFAVLISANAEWKSLGKVTTGGRVQKSPWGEYFYKSIEGEDILFFHEGWGKVAASGATQYVIDRFNPEILINLGTCGGFEGKINRFDVVLADRTVIYDIQEAMGDSKEAIHSYSTRIDLSWLGDIYPSGVKKSLLLSADRDLRKDEIALLKKEYSGIAGDWESGAIAYVANKNNKKIIILRGVTDLVSEKEGEAYGNINLFEQRTDSVMLLLVKSLPDWVRYINKKAGL
jgi:adenosylhomocysteine nucleosidase